MQETAWTFLFVDQLSFSLYNFNSRTASLISGVAMIRTYRALFPLLISLLAGMAAAEGPVAPTKGIKSRAHLDLPLFYNPLGVTLFGGAYVRDVLRVSPKLGCEWSWLQGGATINLNPAYGQGAVYAEWAPAAVFSLRATADAAYSFARFGLLLRYPDRENTVTDQDLADRAGSEIHGAYYRIALQPKFQAQVKRFGGTAACRAVWFYRDDSSYFYEPEFVTLVKGGDFLIAQDYQLFGEVIPLSTGLQLLVGPSCSAFWVRNGDHTLKLGGFAYWVIRQKAKNFRDIRAFAAGGGYLTDRSRPHQGYAALGAGFDLCLKE